MRNKISKRLIIVAPIIFLLIIAIGIGLSFGYMQYSKQQEGNNPFKAACYNVTYKEANEGVSIENGYPISDEEGLQSEPYTVTVTNNCSTALTYDVLINVMNSSTTPEDYIKVAYNDEPSILSDNEKVDTEVSDAKYAYAVGHGVIESKQSTTINLKSWLASTVTGTQAENTYFANKVSIQMNANNLATKIINNNTVLTDTIENLAKAEPRGINFSETVNENINVNIQNASSHYIGTSYEFDSKSGKYTINGTDNQIINETHKGQYICLWGKICSKMYKIKEISNGEITKVDTYTSTYEGQTTGSGLYAIEDDDGTSYLFRGEIENNYVAFANMLWRIVRINGDGSIRMISQEYVGESAFNAYEVYDRKYAGYTYDNSAPNVQDGTPSTIKTYLDNWYEESLISYDDKIAITTYCNDTTSNAPDSGQYYEGYYYQYNTFIRVNNNTITLKCPKTKELYGGKYKLKIGLLNIEEINFAGLDWSYHFPKSIKKNYLVNDTNYEWLTLSPYFFTQTSTGGFSVVTEISNRRLNLNHYQIRPVINLKSNVKVSSGDGTKNKPYVID